PFPTLFRSDDFPGRSFQDLYRPAFPSFSRFIFFFLRNLHLISVKCPACLFLRNIDILSIFIQKLYKSKSLCMSCKNSNKILLGFFLFLLFLISFSFFLFFFLFLFGTPYCFIFSSFIYSDLSFLQEHVQDFMKFLSLSRRHLKEYGQIFCPHRLILFTAYKIIYNFFSFFSLLIFLQFCLLVLSTNM